MNDKTQRLIEHSAAGFLAPTTYAVLVLLLGLALGWVLGRALSRLLASPSAGAFFRRVCPFLGLLAASPLAYKLLFLA